MARQAGIEYFPMDVDMMDDDKVFDLRMRLGGGSVTSDAAFSAFARLVELLAQIYREGYFIELDARKRQRIAYTLGMAEDALDSFIGTCVECGIFDEGLWTGCSVLTSRGIQERYSLARKRSVRDLDGPFVLIGGKSREISGNIGQLPDEARRVPKNPAEEKEKGKEKEEEKTVSRSGGMAEELPCLSVPASESSVFIDLAKGPHQTALGSIAASYAAVTGMDPRPFVCGLAGRCPPSCRGGPEQADECYQLVMKALGKFDPAKGRDPWPLVKTILDQERGSR